MAKPRQPKAKTVLVEVPAHSYLRQFKGEYRRRRIHVEAYTYRRAVKAAPAPAAPVWGEGKPWTSFDIFIDAKTGKQVAKADALKRPKSVIRKKAYVSKITRRRIGAKERGTNWIEQGIIDSQTDTIITGKRKGQRRFKTPDGKRRLARSLVDTLHRFRADNRSPRESNSLRRYFDWLHAHQPSFEKVLQQEGLLDVPKKRKPKKVIHPAMEEPPYEKNPPTDERDY